MELTRIRVAFVSDIHGNLAALDATLGELRRRGPFHTTVGGGDYALGGAYPAECVARLRELGWDCVRGNTDEWIVEAATDGRIPARGYPPEMARTPAQREGDAWTAARLSPGQIEWLAELPLDWRLTGPSGKTLAYVHATPWNTHDVVRRGNSDEDKLRLLDDSGADTLVYGHIHDGYIQQFGARTLACAGSIGLPVDGDTRGAFVIATDAGDGWQVEPVRVPYDQEAYIAALLGSGMPGAENAARMLRAASFNP